MVYPKDYDPNVNYIGIDGTWHKRMTDKFFQKISGYNYSAYWHDFFYGEVLSKELGIANLYGCKFLMDCLFLVQGLLRCLRKGQVHAIIIGPILFLALVFSSPIVINKIRARQKMRRKNVPKGKV